MIGVLGHPGDPGSAPAPGRTWWKLFDTDGSCCEGEKKSVYITSCVFWAINWRNLQMSLKGCHSMIENNHSWIVMWQQYQQPASSSSFFAAKKEHHACYFFSKEYNDVFGQGNLQCDMHIIHSPILHRNTAWASLLFLAGSKISPCRASINLTTACPWAGLTRS